jgi:hypothetical protein
MTIKLSPPTPPPSPRRFLVARMGSTGSAWFAKLLNTHPEVFCSHEGLLAGVYPAKQYTADDVDRFIAYFMWDNKHGAYKAIGDVGSIWDSHLESLPFNTALLVRHPARILYTRLATYPFGQAFTTIPQAWRVQVRQTIGVDLDAHGPVDQIFLYDACVFAGQAHWLRRGAHVIRIEDMQELRSCQAALKALTGVDYDRSLLRRLLGRRVNQRTDAPERISRIVAAFTPQQREWYQTIVGPIIDDFGYRLLDDR